jgi:hypothetical protein
VRRQVVWDAFTWLQIHNPIYSDIQIDENRLKELPVNDMPEELLSIIGQEKDDEQVEVEGESYLSTDSMNEDDTVSMNSLRMRVK